MTLTQEEDRLPKLNQVKALESTRGSNQRDMYTRVKCLQVGTQYRLSRIDQNKSIRQEYETKNIPSLEEMAGASSAPKQQE